MTDQDFMTLALLLFIAIAAILMPPGPGTPLPDRAQSQ